jgi:hypothetical protein
MLLAYYPPLYADSAEELLEQSVVLLRRYLMALGRFDRDTLESGWNATVTRHKGQGWPTIQEIVTECEFYAPDDGWRKDEGWNSASYPSKARPDYSYQVSLGIMSQADADRHMTAFDCTSTGEMSAPRTQEEIARVEAITRQAKEFLMLPDSLR